jgi:CheY-like chemotaxis protein
MRHRALIASQPSAFAVIERMLAPTTDLIAVHSKGQALEVLANRSDDIDLVICTVAFDESRMIDFLQTVKRNPATSGIPFLCVRVLPSVLSDSLIGSVRLTCTDCGAMDLLDLATLDEDAAQAALRVAVTKYAAPRAGGP